MIETTCYYREDEELWVASISDGEFCIHTEKAHTEQEVKDAVVKYVVSKKKIYESMSDTLLNLGWI